MEELYTMTAVEIKHAIQHRRVGVEELVNTYLERIQKNDGIDGLNTIAELDMSVIDQARKMDSGMINRDVPLFGLPVLVKDNIDVAGLHTTAGSLSLADNIALCDAPIMANLRKNGALILGKTNMTEFANYTTQNMPNGYSSRGGQVKNAYDRTKDPGGSSTGSAVAMSAGFCAAAVGTDTSFSVIGCATENGVTGLKPAHGLLSSQGIIPISRTLDSAGALTRDMSDALLLYSGMRESSLSPITPTNPHELHIAVNISNRDTVSDKQLARYEILFDALRKAGANFTEVFHPDSPHMGDIMRCEFRHDLEDYLSVSPAKNKTLNKIVGYYESNPECMMKFGVTSLRTALNEASGKLDDPPYISALAERERLRGQTLEYLRDFDACVMTGPTEIMHFVGLPSVALKLCMADDDTPRGIILYGADESRLYAAALAIEKYCLPISRPSL